MTDNTSRRANVGRLMRRPDPAALVRTGDLRLLAADRKAKAAGKAPKPILEHMPTAACRCR